MFFSLRIFFFSVALQGAVDLIEQITSQFELNFKLLSVELWIEPLAKCFTYKLNAV